jgi:quercetin dioxygenase-like cupin family protein
MSEAGAFKDYRQFTAYQPGEQTKVTLFRGDRLLLGLNCLAPGQRQSLHSHSDQDKFYLVLEGSGEFEVAGERRSAGPGMIVWAGAGKPHSVVNIGQDGLVVLVGIAPAPAGK